MLSHLAFHCLSLLQLAWRACSTEAPFKTVPQNSPCVKHTRLNGAHGQAEAPSSLGAGQTLQLTEQNDDPQVLSKPSNCLMQGCVAFGLAKHFFWCRSTIGNLDADIAFCGIQTMCMKRLSSAALAQEYQGFIDRYSCKPGGERRVFAETFQID